MLRVEMRNAMLRPSRPRSSTLAPLVGVSLGVALMIASPTLASARPAASVTVDKMQALYNKNRDFKGKFKQVFTDSLYNRKRTSYGYLWVKKHGRMRWDYSYPERKSFISDGKILWVYEPEDKQAFKNPLSTKTLSTGLTFLLGSGSLKAEFNFAYVKDKKLLLGGPNHLVLKLTPKKPTSQYKFLVLAVRPTDFAVEESMVVSRNNSNHFVFTNLKFDTGVQRWRFTFKPPAHIRVIDGAKMRTRRPRRPKTP